MREAVVLIVCSVIFALIAAFLAFRAIRTRCHFYTTLAISSAVYTAQMSLQAHSMSSFVEWDQFIYVQLAANIIGIISTWLLYVVALVMLAQWIASVRDGFGWSGVARAVTYLALAVFTLAWVGGMAVSVQLQLDAMKTFMIANWQSDEYFRSMNTALTVLLLAIPVLWIIMLCFGVVLFFATHRLTAAGKPGLDKRLQLLRIMLVLLLSVTIILVGLFVFDYGVLYVAMVITWVQLLLLGIDEMPTRINWVLSAQQSTSL